MFTRSTEKTSATFGTRRHRDDASRPDETSGGTCHVAAPARRRCDLVVERVGDPQSRVGLERQPIRAARALPLPDHVRWRTPRRECRRTSLRSRPGAGGAVGSGSGRRRCCERSGRLAARGYVLDENHALAGERFAEEPVSMSPRRLWMNPRDTLDLPLNCRAVGPSWVGSAQE